MQSVRNRCKWISAIGFLLVLSMLIVPCTSAFAEEAPKITAMTRNLYLGADIFKVVEAAQTDPNQVPFAVAEVYQTMLFTNFWARAEAIADEIAANKPQVVGLQEVSTFYKQTPGDFLIGNPTPASDLVIDFYTVLNDALEARGMYYDKFEVTNADVELPMADPNAPPYFLSDVRMVDHDMILVRKGHPAVQVLGGNYQTNLEMQINGLPLKFTRGYLGVDVGVKDDVFRFVNTHLEVRSSPGSVFRAVQAAQMQELMLTLGYLSSADPKPIVLVGDFNSSPEDVPGYSMLPSGEKVFYVPPYMQAAVYFGYLDAWLQQDQYDEGYTSGFDEYVSDPAAELTSRIDLVFLKSFNLTLDKVNCEVVGNEVSDMVPNPAYSGAMLWPSDHAGVVAKVKFME